MTEPGGESIEIPHGSIPWVYASTVSLTVAGALFFLYMARVLPLGQLGAIVILQAFAMIISVVVALGLNAGYQHFLAFYRARGDLSIARTLVGTSYVAAALLFLATLGITVALSSGLSHLFFHSGQYTLSIEYLGIFSGLVTAARVFQGVLLGFQRYAAYGATSTLGNIAMYSVPVVLIQFFPSVQSIVFGWILGATAGVVASLVAILWVVRRTGAPSPPTGPSLPALHLSRTVLLYSLPVLASGLLTTSTYYVDRLILASVANLAIVGIYNYAILFAGATLFVVTPFSSILVPRVSALFGRGDRDAIRRLGVTSSTLVVLAYAPLGLGVAAIGPFLLRVLVGGPFVAASWPMAVLLAITALFVPFAVLVSIATGVRRTSVLAGASALALVFNTALSVVLVPRIGMLGAAIGNSAMFWAPFLALYFVLRGTGLVQFDTRSIVRIWVAVGAMVVVAAVPLILLRYDALFVPVFVLAAAGTFLAVLRTMRAIPGEVADVLHQHLPHSMARLRPLICWASACDHCRHGQQYAPVVPSATPSR